MSDVPIGNGRVGKSAAGYVEFDHVWKKFRYGEHNHLRDVIPAIMRRAFRRPDPEAGLWTGEFWALRDVDFRVRPGEAFGIIGPNGAGKSTILKLLTRIFRPTHGRCAIRGRVGALIEVTAGFHPDLTGRENVFLQGAIMGMPRRDIRRRFDEIVEFAGISHFIDTPVKRYSSGMQARLGFSIAAHLEPEVLIVDEALAVGDESFQRQAFARVRELVKQHIPVVVVSHQLDAIQSLCTHAMLLDRGCVVQLGSPAECIATYLKGVGAVRAEDGDGPVRIDAMRLDATAVVSGGMIDVELDCEIRADTQVRSESVRVCVRAAASGTLLCEADSVDLGLNTPTAGAFSVAVRLQLNVPSGLYIIESLIWDRVRGRTLCEGPTHYLEVTAGVPFSGSVQMNPTVRVAVASSRPA